MPDIYEFLILSAFVWRMSSLLVEESGPPIYEDAEGFHHYLFDWLRHKVGIRYEAGEAQGEGWSSLFLCVWCMSLWIGFAVAFLWLAFPTYRFALLFVAFPFALSAATIFFSEIIKHGKG